MNAPIPTAAETVVQELQTDLPADCRPRDRLTLVVKRVGEGETDHRELAARCRDALSGEPRCAARVAGVDVFDADDGGPVLHLRVDSPGLRALHRRLCRAFDPVPVIEGEDYVPHVTLGRGGDPDAVQRFRERYDGQVDPVEWTVSDLLLWSNRWREPVATLPLGT
nr:2'-5' RNA ligase family protein [Halomarina salina]